MLMASSDQRNTSVLTDANPSVGSDVLLTIGPSTQSQQYVKFQDDVRMSEPAEQPQGVVPLTAKKATSLFSTLLCGKKHIGIYRARMRLRLIISLQAFANLFCVLPIILGVFLFAVLPVMSLILGLLLGWHGASHLLPRFLSWYVAFVVLSIIFNVVFFATGKYQYNGDNQTAGTAFVLLATATVFITILDFVGCFLAWYLRIRSRTLYTETDYVRATMIQADLNELENAKKRKAEALNTLRSMGFGDSDGLKQMRDQEDAAIKEAHEDGFSAKRSGFASNSVITSRYNFYNFLFYFLKDQFSRVANLYTLVIVILCFFDFSPVSPSAALTPLLIVMVSAAFKEIAEDFKRRKADKEVNGRGVTHVDTTTAELRSYTWSDISVGDILILQAGDIVPADVLMLCTSRRDGRCYVETSNLDGESNLKLRNAPKCTKGAQNFAELVDNYTLSLMCGAPSANLFEFDGTLTVEMKKKIDAALPQRDTNQSLYEHEVEGDDEGEGEGQMQGKSGKGKSEKGDEGSRDQYSDEPASTAVNQENMLWRGTVVRSTKWVCGLVVYTGTETRIEQSSTKRTNKKTKVELLLNGMLVGLLLTLFSISIFCTLGANNYDISSNDLQPNQFLWYLGDDYTNEDDFTFISYVILFNSMIPLSLYVTMEGIRFVHARYIEDDIEMYDEETNTPAQVRNSNINEDLGQVEYIFSDKTGTLTCNEMIFAKCTIAGLRYGDEEIDPKTEHPEGTRFVDKRLLERLTSQHKSAKDIHHFLMLLCICNTVVPEHGDPDSDLPTSYQAASPDELCLVQAARDLGYILLSRSGKRTRLRIQGKDQVWEVLNVLEFNSDRKRMSIICRSPENKIFLYCKGADSVIFSRLAKEGASRGVIQVTKGHLEDYASEGLRTLSMAMAEIPHRQYHAWSAEYQTASTALVDRAEKVADVSAKIEVNLLLVGASAIEDRLQDDVGETISSLREAGIKFWILTGDKQETAISIGFSTKTIDDHMELVILAEKSKAALRTRLERLYNEIVDTKSATWTLENDSITQVIWKGSVKFLLNIWDQVSLVMVGFRQRRKKKRTLKKSQSLAYHRRIDRQESMAGGTAVRFEAPKRTSRLGGVAGSPNEIASPYTSEPYRSFSAELEEAGVQRLKSNEYIDSSSDSGSSSPDAPAGFSQEWNGIAPRAGRREAMEDMGGRSGSLQIEEEEEEVSYCLVIDGPTLKYALDDDIKYLFAAVAKTCESVICCRCSPSQKAGVVRLISEPALLWSSGSISLSIGDGANDVPMIKAANVGVGVSGKEGRQAVLNSDFSIAQFRFLKKLLLVHGNYSYKRMAKLILFSIMKNVALCFSILFFAKSNKYSGMLQYFDILFTFYNALFTTIPIVAVAMFNQDIYPQALMQYPALYSNGLRSRSFNVMSFLGWMALGVWHAWIVWEVPFTVDGYAKDIFSPKYVKPLLFTDDSLGLWADGTAGYTYLIAASTLQVSLLTSNWTKYNVWAVGSMIILYVIILWFLSSLSLWSDQIDVFKSYDALYLLHKLFGQPWFWLCLVLTSIAACLPNYILKAWRVLFYPEPSHLMSEWQAAQSTMFKFPGSSSMDENGSGAVRIPLRRDITGFAFAQEEGQAGVIMELSDSPLKELSDEDKETPSDKASLTASPTEELNSVNSQEREDRREL